jgi:RecB family endonuclease NucS
VALLAMMGRQEQIGIPEISFVPKRKAADLPDLQRRVVEMLPGCGMVMAREMLQHFGSVERIVAASRDGLREVRGVGAKKADEMWRVLHAEYEAVDTERDLEDAIEAEPSLLFDEPMELVERQHYVFSDAGERQFVDMVFLDPQAVELVLVELKRGRLAREHAVQLRRYLDNAHRSKLLRAVMEEGAGIRGVLATVEECEFEPKDDDIAVRIVDKVRAVKVLTALRRRRREDA